MPPASLQVLRRLRALWLRLSAWMPLALLALAAAFSWWVAQVVMQAEKGAEKPPARPTLPDYVLHDFHTARYDAQGRLTSLLSGRQMVHDPAQNIFTLVDPRLRAESAAGVVITAQARQGRSNADGSNLQLIGNAVVRREAAGQPPLVVRSAFLNLFPHTQVVESNRPTQIEQGASRLSGDQLRFDGLQGTLAMDGRVRAVLVPTSRAGEVAR